jgi:hypothetical protein
MADSILVRFEDDIAKALRDRVRGEDRSLNRFINDAVQAYLAQLEAKDEQERVRLEWTHERVARFATYLADTKKAITEGQADASQSSEVWAALRALADCVESLPVPMEGLDPVTWEQFKYSRLNDTGSDQAAQEMFARDAAEIEARDWKWYRQHYATDSEAKLAWFKQRRRYGLPIPSTQKTQKASRRESGA